MQSILEFLDRHAVDPHIFFSLPSARAELGRVELFWERKRATDRWRLRSQDKLHTEYCDYVALPATLGRWGVSAFDVEHQLKTVALTQVFFAQSLLEDATRVFGAGQIAQATAEHRQFLDSLKKVVTSLVRRPLQAVAGEGTGGGRSKARLSLVPSESHAEIG